MTRNKSLLREKKAVPAALSSIGEDGLFEGYACLFGKEDLGRDIIRRGAFMKSLDRRGVKGVKLLYQHDPSHPVGQWTSIKEDAKGLFVRGQLALDVAKARDVHSMMKAGILDGLSIGFRTIRGQTDRKAGVRHLFELDLWEISIVTFPMQPDARISSIKTDDASLEIAASCLSKRELERKLMQDAGLSRTEARALLAQGYAGLDGKQDAARWKPQSPLLNLHRLTLTMRSAARSLSKGSSSI